MSLLLAIDGGNSKTQVLVCDDTGAVLGHALGPGSNHQTAGGLGIAMDRLNTLVAQARDNAGLSSADRIALAAVYLAGADLPVELTMLADAVTAAGWADKSLVDNDTLALLRAGTPDPDAVAVVCGAGINCVGRAADGRTVRFPALGTITGDWGGGDDLGPIALWHASRAEDGRGPATALTGAIAGHFGLRSATAVAAAAHLDPGIGARLGELAPVLFATSRAGDPVARSIVVRQGEEVALLAIAALRRLELVASPATVVLGGGVLRGRDPLLHDTIRDRLADATPLAEITVVTDPPVVGAALLGLDALGTTPGAAGRLRTWSTA
ncbi:N-acetylglucosamine kinase [Actinophytocola algeriensis]|uniref:N-acetylglucosamine kinase-like BadF-type ATPase n=1 Tax=Actinophytocola algeriensis TaxID=1768010 RepID=A0A7W7QFG9_9PSEU|nr:BadF/BadG/BcrA/BcrD ATPase family protein [Actinophytocola algeriensis]MBB4912607.1 N-acetylglucosamine kinase-like BadF-type ATPase [Actinophytocola algeriensis]MBE1478981.1 N-acetylglucosamine kinase-like BadF-type ATPase [Actinophytocola algeriensis]